MKLGYLVPEFPGQTHAFFWREAVALREMGFGINFISTKKPEVPGRHDFAALAMAQTTYLFPPEFFKALKYLLGHPRLLMRAIDYVVRLEECSYSEKGKLLALVLVAAHLKLHCDAEGINHLHVHSFATSAHIASLSRILGGPTYSLTLHGDLDVYGKDHRAKCKNASFLTAVTRPLCNQLVSLIPEKNTLEISMGVDVEKFSFKERQSSPEVKVVSVARLNHTKGHVFFLEAMAERVSQGQNIIYTIAGDGPNRQVIEERIESLGLQSRVNLLGEISESEVLSLLHASDIFALNSFGLGEAAPVAVMEAMATGLPVICSDIGGTGAMIEDGIDGILVPQQDKAAIVSALRKLDAVSARQAMGQRARLKAERNFDFREKARLLGEKIKSL